MIRQGSCALLIHSSGFIHGGNLIKLMEEAGFVAATRQIAFANAGGGGDRGGACMLGALARIERLDFLLPVEVCSYDATTAPMHWLLL